MPNLYYAADYKRRIIRLLQENADFITVMDRGQFLDFFPTPDTAAAEQTYAAVEVCIDTVRQNTYVDFNLYVYLFTHRSLITLTSESSPPAGRIREMGYTADKEANRIDVLCDIADRILNGTDMLPGIGRVEPASEDYVTLFSPSGSYYGKRIKYGISGCSDGGGINEA